MRILVINAGSTSLKYKLFKVPNFEVLKEGNHQNIQSHQAALKDSLREIGDLRDIIAIGHRVVHGGSFFHQPTKITLGVLKTLKKISYLAPLHNPANLAGIRACQKFLPDINNIACFDTAYFAKLPERAKIYALPEHFYRKEKIQRYGFHGLSHKYVALKAAKRLKKPITELNLITVHLGGGCSMTAIQKGKPIDTSMGFTPLEGLVMMTRGGDIDPGVLLEIAQSHTLEELKKILNYESGLKGLSGYDNYLKFLKALKAGKKKAKLAFDLYVYRIQKYIGAYTAILGRVDALVFSGQIGSGKAITRKTICAGIAEFLGETKILAIQTNEEKMIAQEVYALNIPHGI